MFSAKVTLKFQDSMTGVTGGLRFILNLLFEIHCTPAEVARLEKINGMLLEMTNRTYLIAAD